MDFIQPAPELANQYEDDRVLRSLLRRLLPPEILRAIEPELRELGALSGDELYAFQLRDRASEPRHTRWSAWGERIDRIELTPLWHEAERIAARSGIVATAYERKHGALSRLHQFALAYLFTPSTDLYSCPLAMTDGAARTLELSGSADLIDRALPRLTSRDPEQFWTSGQWMTEATGGSDVGGTRTIARRDGDRWRLHGLKWFTSAATSQMALALARVEGDPDGSRGLSLFYLECHDDTGRLRNIRVRRLKEKLGTRKLPTAELELDGVEGWMIGERGQGVRTIVPLLNLTRTWNAVSACAFMRRGIALARDYAGRRRVFGRLLSEQPLHLDTLAALQAELEGAMHLTFRVVELIGRSETDAGAPGEDALLRLLTPIAKLLTARQAVSVVSECLEAHGGAGYIEDTGLPQLLRDTQVLTIWEGTTNVLALDLLRGLQASGADPLTREIDRCSKAVSAPPLREATDRASAWYQAAEGWRGRATQEGDAAVQAGARHYAIAVGRALELVLAASHAQWALDEEHDRLPLAAVLRLAMHPVALGEQVLDTTRALAMQPGGRAP